MAFSHLHVHTQYSILDGASRIKSTYRKANPKKGREKELLSIGLIDKAVELGMPSIAITDHGNMFGAVEFYQEAKAKGIIPIIGCELYVAPKTRFDRKTDNSEEKSALHLVMLAKDKEGYENLIKLVSLGYTEGFYYKPRIDHDLIAKYHKGIIALSACIGGEIPTRIRRNDYDGAVEIAKKYQSIFGEDFYIELQDQGIENQRQINFELFKLAKENNIQTIITNDVHYVSKDDAKAHDVLLAVQTKSSLNNPNRFRFPSHEFYMKSEEEMRVMFPKMNNSFKNTQIITDKCRDLNILTKEYYMPKYPMDEGETEKTTLRNMCVEGLNKRFNGEPTQEALDRLEMELGVIGNMGFEGYFLIVQDFINWAKAQDISVGPGRGSAAGSIVSYSIGITDINPLDYNLLFERFLNPDRISMPDIDIDFQDDRRDEVIQYVKEKYGHDNVSQIATFSALHGKSVVRDVCRAMDIELSTADRIAKMLPNGSSLIDAYDDIPEFRQAISENGLLTTMYNTALKLEGLVRSVGLHAAGVVVADRPISSLAPVYQDSKTGNRACQYEMNYIEDVGLIKIDFLGIKNLRLIKDSAADINKIYNANLDIDQIPMDDENVFKLFREANTMGVFQFESDGMRNMLVNIAPTSFDDLVSAVALYRPGPLNASMDKEYADVKNNRSAPKYKHKDLVPILGETQGVLIYQEQVMAISRVLAGFTPGEADELRKAMGKKLVEKVEKLEEKFISGGISLGYDKNMLKEMYAMMAGFAEYGFNKSHSVCYAMIAYKQAYIKAYYPIEYYVALLNTVIDDTDKIKLYLTEVRHKAMKVLPPDVNNSSAIFAQKDGAIVYALHGIKGVGIYAAKMIQDEREKNGQYTSLEDFAKRSDTHTINKKIYEALIKAGAFDCFEINTQSLMDSVEHILAFASHFQSESKAGQSMLFDSGTNTDNMESGLSIVKKVEYDSSTLRANEIETVGFNLKHHIFSGFPELDLSKYNNLTDIDNIVSGSEFYVPCLIKGLRETTTKKGAAMLVVETEDMSIEKAFFIMGEAINKYKHILAANMMVVIHGNREKSKYNDNIYTSVLDIYMLEDVISGKAKITSNAQKNKAQNDKNSSTTGKFANNTNNKANVLNNNSNTTTQNNQIADKYIINEIQRAKLNEFDKYVLIYLFEKTFDDMDLHCLQESIEKHPGSYPVVLNLVDNDKDDGVMLGLGNRFYVDAESNFINTTNDSIRSLLKISLHTS